METPSLIQLYHAYAGRRFCEGPRPLADPLRALLKEAWCAETAVPRLREEWSAERPYVGQEDVTAYFVAKRILGGTVARVRLSNGSARWLNWAPNGEDVSVRDYCAPPSGHRILGTDKSLTPDIFFSSVPSADELERRADVFERRFRDALERR